MSTRDTTWPTGYPAWIELSTPAADASRSAYGHLFGWAMKEAESFVVAEKNGLAAAGISSSDEPGSWLTYFAGELTTSRDLRERIEAAGGALQSSGRRSAWNDADIAVVRDPQGGLFGIWDGAVFDDCCGPAPGITITREPGAFGWTTLLTHDLPGAQQFYSAVFGFTYEQTSPDLAQICHPDGNVIGSMHQAEHLPAESPPVWNVHFNVASRDATISMAEMEDGFEVLMSFETPFGAEAVLRGPGGEVFNVTETPESE